MYCKTLARHKRANLFASHPYSSHRRKFEEAGRTNAFWILPHTKYSGASTLKLLLVFNTRY